MESRTSVGILGSGFGGLYTAFFMKKYLGRQIDLTLFDKNNYLLYTPVLHEMATGTVNARHVVIPIRKVIDPLQVHIRCEEVLSVHLAEKAFETSSGRFTFDFLVLAAGSETNFYSIPGVQENCITFKTVEDAIRLRNTMIGVLEKGAIEKDVEKKKKLLTLVVAGGGCTGVEIVAEIAQFIKIILDKDYPEIKRSEVRILLVEAMDRILPTFPGYLSQVATERLKKMGIEILLNTLIQQVSKDFICLRSRKEIPYGFLVWAGGVRARHIPLNPEVDRDQNDRIRVNQYLEIPGYQGVFVVGDGAHFGKNDGLLPPTASVATQQAKYVSQSILRYTHKREKVPFQFHYRGDMASLGFMFGVAEVYGLQFKGFPAWVIWKALKLGMLPRYKNRFQIMADWLITLAFKRDTSKLI